ncbi:MAG TPA: UvrD-helicase domain-containing protein [Acidimicrobiia bacterium]|nr:UvrD-helicase domain-containing protein [Acidimicrobiia bacterium]
MTLELFPPVGDQAARDAIRTDLATTLFVEAGAGTGKTAALVARVVALVTADGPGLPVPMRNIAAITFTEKAAAELRDRVRRELRDRAADPRVSDLERERCEAALDDLDAAGISTLHAFARSMLTDFPIEAGLPPRIEVRDEISSRVAFERRWRDFVDELLDDAELEETVLLMLAAGVRLDHLRAVAEALDDNWDLLDRIGEAGPLPALAIGPWLDELDAICALTGDCRFPDDDKMVERLLEFAEYRDALRAGDIDDVDRVRLLLSGGPSYRVKNKGRQANWTDLPALRERIARLEAERDRMVNEVLHVAIGRVAAALAKYTERTVAERRRAGELEFHDLLVLARTLLRDPEHGVRARAWLRDRYQRVLIDEFQDTDPIQVELAALLGSPVPEDAARPWAESTVDAGRLFFVGDPKQSIYRFRRADIATYLAAADHFAERPQFLTCNFRTVPDVLAWVNQVFTELIRPTPGSQPDYRPLDAVRSGPENNATRVVLLGSEPHLDKDIRAPELRRREAADVALAVRAAITERWPVLDPKTEQWRDARLGDICILLPARTSLGFLEEALTDAGVPYRAESSSLVYGSREVRDVLGTLRAIDDPSDSLALVAALRSAVFGCGDDDLFTYRVEHGGRFDVRFDPPETVPAGHPVGDAMRFLRTLHDTKVWATPSELLERVVRERRVLELGALLGRFRDVARRMRFVIDQARAYEDAQGGTLRDYIGWAELQGTEGARVVEAVLPETDDDAVRILTVHGAKGLEFPIVICSGASTAAQSATRGVQVLFPPGGGFEVKLTKGVQTEHFELHQPVDEQMGFHEKLRLLYVACTRARDHLVVSVHRKARDLTKVDAVNRTHAELLFDAASDANWVAFERPDVVEPVAVAPPLVTDAGIDPAAWEAELVRARTAGTRRAFVAATTLAHRDDVDAAADPGLAKDARDLELPPWNKGRYGTAIGRAVHAALQTVDLTTGADVEHTAAAQAAAEGVLGHEDTIAALVRAAIASGAVQRAITMSHWREMYVAVPLTDLTLADITIADITIEGYVDLVYRDVERGGLVVVDYKTDAVDEQTRTVRVGRYNLQLAAYALALAEATGEPVVGCILCFLEPGGPIEVVLDGAELAAAVGQVRELAAAEQADPSPLPAPVPILMGHEA